MANKLQRFLCSDCIGDKYLKAEVMKAGTRHRCSFCNEIHNCIKLDDIAQRVDEVYREYYQPSDLYPTISAESDNVKWDYHGDFPEAIISEMMQVNDEVAEEIVKLLTSEYAVSVIRDGQDNYYDETSQYEEIEISTMEYSGIWSSFCHGVKHESRFYNSHAEALLKEIFEGVNEYRSLLGNIAVKEIPKGEKHRFVYRGRQADDHLTKLEIYHSPQKELGAPPPSISIAGRMNPSGVSVFYGAFERETCIAELRLPVGSTGITGKFEIIKPIRVLDMTVFDEPPQSLSMFDPNYQRDLSHRLFLKDLHKEIRKPVLPRGESIDYIPTQVIAEYLANRFEPRLDGIIYSSTQTDGRGLNIAVFNHASDVEGIDANQEKGNLLDKYEIREDEYSFVVSEKRNTDSEKDYKGNSAFINLALEDLYTPPIREKESTLKFIEDSLELETVTSITHLTRRSRFFYYKESTGNFNGMVDRIFENDNFIENE